MKSQVIKAVIFDVDGLLLDTERVALAAYLEAASRSGINATEELFMSLVGRNWATSQGLLKDALGTDDAETMLAEWPRTFESRVLGAGIPKKPGADEVIHMLVKRETPVALATSTSRDLATDRLRSAGLLEHFEVIVTGDEVANGKPAPDIFLLAAERLDIEPTACIVLEDSEPGVRAGDRAGMRVLMVPDLIQPSPEVAALATGIFESLVEAQTFLERSLGPV
jgi:HAD superfamily hydrolase (TIGR01509 family)